MPANDMNKKPSTLPIRTEESKHALNRRQWMAQNALYAGATLACAASLTLPQTGFAQESNTTSQTQDFLWEQELTSLNAEKVTLSRYRNQPLLINFWASWCAPCVEEIPLLNSYYEKMPKGKASMVGIAVDTARNVQRFLANTPIDFDVLIAGSRGMQLSQQLGNPSKGIPFSIMLDASGHTIGSAGGLLNSQILDEWFSAAFS